MGIVFEEVTAQVEPATPPRAAESATEPTAEHNSNALRAELARLLERRARLAERVRAD